jgi:signal transduction histidine kinase
VAIGLKRLKWLTLAGIVAFVATLDVLREALYPTLTTLAGRLLMDAFVLSGAIFLIGLLFAYLERQQLRLERQRVELLALHHAALDLGGELGLDALLQKIVDAARQLLGARYGALSVVDREGRIEEFVTSGVEPSLAEKIGPPPVGRGLLGHVLKDGQRLRIADVRSDPRATGFPAHHPVMTALLAVPIACGSPFRGNLYLADRLDGSEFTANDEETLVRFATQAANAIDGSYLHERLRALAIEEERLRLAREMHDGVAQILASVNARSQAIREHLRGGRTDEAIRLLDRLAADARSVHLEVREGILALRATASEGDGISNTLAAYLDDWSDQTGIGVEADLDRSIQFAPEREVQVLRIAQEALANVRKHSGAEKVRISFRNLSREAVLEIADDGRGFDPERPAMDGRPRFGLVTMRERAAAVDGSIDVAAAPGRGTVVRLTLPVGRGAGAAPRDERGRRSE